MKSYLGSALLASTVMTAALGCYMVSLKVSSERAAVDDLRRIVAADTRDIRLLQAELRTRARLPELQRWNDQVLALTPPSERQFVRDAVQLASYAPGAAVAGPSTPGASTAPLPAAPRARFAIVPPVPTAQRPLLQTVAYTGPRPDAPLPAVAATVPASLGVDADLGAAIAVAAAAETASGPQAAMQ